MSQTNSGRQSGSGVGRTGRDTPRADQHDTRKTIQLKSCSKGCHGTQGSCGHQPRR